MKNGLCFTQKVLILVLLFVEIRNQRFKVYDNSKNKFQPNFSQVGQKTREVEFRPGNCLMTSQLPYDNDVRNMVMGLERFCF